MTVQPHTYTVSIRPATNDGAGSLNKILSDRINIGATTAILEPLFYAEIRETQSMAKGNFAVLSQ